MKQLRTIIDEKGSIMIVALLILLLLTVIGISATTTTITEIQIAGNEKVHKIAFYAAEAAREYVKVNTGLYGVANTTVGGLGITFPDAADLTVQQQLAPGQSFSGTVTYKGKGTAAGGPSRGTGDAQDKIEFHRYQIDITGSGPANATCQLLVEFYRKSPK